MTDGCNMGVKLLHRYLNKYEAVDERVKAIVHQLLNLELKLAWNICTFLEENGGANPPFFNEEAILVVGEANGGAVFARDPPLLFFGPRIRSGAVTGRVVNGSIGNVYDF